ncbi:ABC transporter ATP-binding protein, partial [Bacillus subtilis]|nr:ABC transporter ATP-binding protein [Bacillus subtilis]
MANALLQIDGFSARFGTKAAVQDLNLSVGRGERVALVGESGSGKSVTALSILRLAQQATLSGRMLFDGKDLLAKTERQMRGIRGADIAMVFQSYALYPSMTVRENISFGLNIRKVPKSEQQQIVDRVSAMLQIQHLLDRKPGQLSGGQRQRVAMGRALARDPSLFLFDEPLSNLDAKLRIEMRAEIKLLHQRLGTTIVYVTHDQIEAMTLGDRIAVMKDGVVQQFGAPQEIYDSPSNLFVAGFIGAPKLNVLKGAVESADAGGVLVRFDSGETQRVAVNAAGLQRGAAVTVGVRPEHLLVDA